MFLLLYLNHPEGKPNGSYDIARQYLELHPVEMELLIDKMWAQRAKRVPPSPPNDMISSLPIFEQASLEKQPEKPCEFYHLIYAYLIENTRVYEIFERVMFEYLHGERLGFPAQSGTYKWMRATEELFYKTSSNYLVQSIVSNIRPDIRASRRNAYYRMFGMDLNHGNGRTANYPYQKPVAANKEFVPIFEEFLSEIWIGITNATNLVGQNPTDDSKINDLIRRLRELLTTRKQRGNMVREEFCYVVTMSWMHLTLFVEDAPIVQDMGIHAESAAERLRQMGERVGYPAHPKADAFFEMAVPLSDILLGIEHSQNLNSQAFYAPSGPLRSQAETIITQWSIATGRDLKSLKVRAGTAGVSAR